MQAKLVVFDLDGTLLDTIGDLACACNHMLRLRSLAEHSLADYRHFVGNGVTRLVERALPEQLRTTEYVAEARRDFIDYYIDHIDLHTEVYRGIAELLEQLQQQGILLAVASNKFNDGTRKLISRFFPSIRFEAVYGNRDGFPMKPDPALMHLLLKECSTDASECVMVGDSGVDMQFAAAAGVRSIGVTWGFRPREELEASNANHIVTTPEELLKLLV